MKVHKRTIIESVIKELKTQTQVEHSRHRSFANFQVNVVSALIAYQFLETKPSVNIFERKEQISDKHDCSRRGKKVRLEIG